MLSASDIITGKIVIQLGLADADFVRGLLRDIDAHPDANRDLVNRLYEAGKIDAKGIEFLRHRVALYEHVRNEAVYVRLMERGTSIQKGTVARLLAQLERSAFRRRLGDVLVKRGSLKPEYDRSIVKKREDVVKKDNERILQRYRDEDFVGVTKPLIPNSRLDPAEFKISTLFRSKQTRVLVDKAEIALLRKEAERAKAAKQAAAEDVTLILGEIPAGVDVHADTKKLPPGAVDEAKAAVAAERAADEAGDEPAGTLSIEEVKNLTRIADYTVVETLGVGGMGAVFLGQKDGAGEYCAIKVLLNQAATEEEKGRFNREITLAQAIQHQNVLGIIEVGTTPQGFSFMVVPALAGKELRELLELDPDNGLAPPLVHAIFVQVLQGMQAIHEMGIVHRDMKPENVFVLAGGMHDCKIMDFGLAKPSTDKEAEIDVFQTQTGEVSGSPAYIAPESVTSDPIDGRTDIYSLGIMLFELFTGKLPLSSETSSGYLTQHLICPPLTLAEAKPDVAWPPELEGLLERMMGKTRDERPESCAAILAELEAGLGEKIDKIMSVSEAAAKSQVEQLDAPTEEKPKWGFKGLLGRLRGSG